MGASTPILRVKLCPPASAGLLPRESQRQLGKEILSHRLTTVTAGAGYGKSALISQALSCLETDHLWYRLDETDGEPTAFLHYLRAGIAAQIPDFDFPLPQNLSELLADQQAGSALWKEFLVALEAASPAGLVIVLDDFHSVQNSSLLMVAVDLLLQYAPPEVHFVICSRATIALPLSHMRADQQLRELATADLRFTSQETRELFREKFSLPLEDRQLAAISQNYQGWIAGLILLGQGLQGSSAELPVDLDLANNLLKSVRDYFTEVVYRPLDSQLQDFLLHTALLDPLRVGVCVELTSSRGSAAALKLLCERGLFIERQPAAETYRYQPLFRLFLRQQLTEELGSAGVRQQHRSIALLHEARNEISAALEHYLAAGDSACLCRLLDQQGQRLFQQGHFELLRLCFEQLPTEQLVDSPRVAFLQGRLLGFFGDPGAAAQAYRRALAIFETQADRQGVPLCLIEIAISSYHVGDMGQAADLLDELLALPDISAELRLEATGYQIFLASYLKDQPQRQDLYHRTAAVLDTFDTSSLSPRQKAWLDVYRGYAFNVEGERQRALEIGRSVAWRLQELEGEQGIHGCYALIANVCFYLQLFAEGLEWAEKGLALLATAAGDDLHQPARSLPSGSRERGTQDTTLPLLLHHAANNAFGLGKTAQAIAYARQSAVSFRGMGVKWGEAWALNMLSTAYAQQGDLVLAEQSSLAALDCCRGLGLLRIEGSIKGNLSVYLLARGRHAEALPLLEAAEKAFTAKHLARWVDLWYANYYWRQNREKGRRRLQRALLLFDKHQDFGILAERHWIVPLLVDSFARGLFRNYIMTVLRQIGSDALWQIRDLSTEQAPPLLKSSVANLLRELPKPAAPGLKISLLGPFQLSVGEREILNASWRNRKARILLQYLAHELPKGYIAREVLTELLWPEADPQKTKNRFHVAMTALRKLLEPDLPDGVPSSYISRSGEAYRLQLGVGGYVDLHDFNEHLALAKKESDPEQASKLRLEALSDYSGELLAEDPYCEWCGESRERLRREYLDSLEKLMRYYGELGELSKSIDCAESYLQAEPTAEPIYRALMNYHARTGNLLLVSTCLHRCRENLLAELDCPPEEQTERLARQLLTEAAEPDC